MEIITSYDIYPPNSWFIIAISGIFLIYLFDNNADIDC